jgi:K+-sensing histidine kinase KdpD
MRPLFSDGALLRGVLLSKMCVHDQGTWNEVFSSLSRELRQPLAPILTSVEILRLSGAFADGRTAQACAILERQVLELKRLLDDLTVIAGTAG